MSDEKKLDQLRRIDEELKCSICTRLIDDPHTLMCGHNFCGHCLMNWFVQKKACPTCRTPAIKQPIQNITLQKISQMLWPDNHVPDRKLQRSDWLELYPVQNQGSYIRDEDGEGVILRCSNCAWELDEELFCAQCLIYYDDGQDRSNIRYNEEEVTDTESHHEEDEDLEDFVVQDDHIDYENLDSDLVLDDPSEHESDNHMNVYSSDNEENEVYRTRSNKRRRVISDDEDDSETNTVIPIEDDESDVELSINRAPSRYTMISDEELDEDDEEEYPDDPFPREKCKFIDDYAEEDDDEEDPTPKPPKIDKISQAIAQAKIKAESSSSSNSKSKSSPIDLDSSDDDSGSEPDYNF